MIKIGDTLPPFTLPRTDGRAVRWAAGRVTVFSLCAFWCDTWREQARRLAEAKRQTRGLPAAFWTVSVDGRWMERHTRVPEIRADELLCDAGGAWSRTLAFGAVPYTFVVSEKGVVVASWRGIVRADALAQAVRRAAAH